jgi:hypothetical protein
MSDHPVLYSSLLTNGLNVTVSDVSKHYYGGYWQVILEIQSLVSVEQGKFSDVATASAARALLGEVVPFVRRLEQMAVRVDQLDDVRKALLDRFALNMLPFLEHEHFAARFIQTEYLERSKKRTRGIPCLL